MGIRDWFKHEKQVEIPSEDIFTEAYLRRRSDIDSAFHIGDYFQCDTVGWASTGYVETEPLYRSYVEKEVEPKPCPYCGNYSDRRDAVGNCAACGGPRKP